MARDGGTSCRERVGVLALVLATVAAACGGDNGASTAPTGACGSVEIVVRADGSTTGRTPPTDDQSLVNAVADSFCATFAFVLPTGAKETTDPPITSRREADCIGTDLVRTLGAARVRELGFATQRWSLLGFGLRNHSSIQRPEAETIVGIFATCSKSWEQLLIRSATQGSDEISEASARCTAERLSDKDARAILASDIDRAYDDPSTTAPPFGVEAKPLFEALEKCLTREELEKLDWN